MKIFLVAFALIDNLKVPTDVGVPHDGECVRDGDYVGYLFEDQRPSLPTPPKELAGELVLLWQHRSSDFRDEQRRWLDKSQAKIWPLPLFSHVGSPRQQLRGIFVEKSGGELRDLVGEFYSYGAVDLLEQTLGWNALMQFPAFGHDQKAAEKQRDRLAATLKYRGVMEENLQALGLSPREWEERLRARLAERSTQLGAG